MLDDLVIDTNVFCNSYNPENQYFVASGELLDTLLDSETLLCVDEDADFLVEANNRSYIVAEYLTHVSPLSTAYPILVSLFSNKRIRFLSRNVPNNIRRKITEIVTDKTDRIFLRIAYNSNEMTLVAHDDGYYHGANQKRIHDEIGVDVIAASECVDKL